MPGMQPGVGVSGRRAAAALLAAAVFVAASLVAGAGEGDEPPELRAAEDAEDEALLRGDKLTAAAAVAAQPHGGRALMRGEAESEAEVEISDASAGGAEVASYPSSPSAPPSNKCGIDLPCHPCYNEPGSVCSIDNDVTGFAKCKKICGTIDAHRRLLSLKDSFDTCMVGRTTSQVKAYFEYMCGDYKNYWPHSSVTAPAPTKCFLNAGKIRNANYSKNVLTIHPSGMLEAKCGNGLMPNVPELKCAYGALFPGTFSCTEKICKAPEMPNGYPGGSCLEGETVNSREWCTPKCASGFTPVWRPDEVRPEDDICNLTERPANNSICCYDGQLPKPLFKCYASSFAPAKLRQAMSKQLFGIVQNVVPAGMTKISGHGLSSMPAASVEFVANADAGVFTHFRGIRYAYEFKADMILPIPEEFNGRGRFKVNVTGDLDMLWDNGGLLCNPFKLNCDIRMLEFKPIPEDGSELTEPLVRFDATKKFEWMRKFDKNCANKICDRMNGWMQGHFNTEVIDPALLTDYTCAGWDPGVVLIFPCVVCPFLTLAFIAFSRRLFLRRWQRDFLNKPKQERQAVAQGADPHAKKEEGESKAAGGGT
eukprot:TRINITY_DN31116_c0_g1_i1.p1 TRINITY_DN31116_c0_g1~~TRINITY_DN31116_c0_g1_i1.p1  ORF type:complete len:594 (-),score=123.91 TRINITY_DN31116_c0_g1_i1:79-1860(-)